MTLEEINMNFRLVVVASLAAIAVLSLTGIPAATHAASGPSGRLAYAGDGGLYVAAADGSAAHRIWAAPGGGAIHDPHWSPDGSHIAFAGPDGNIWTVNGDGSGARALTAQGVAPSGCGEDACADAGVSADS